MSTEERIRELEVQVTALQAAVRLMGGKPADGSFLLEDFIMDTVKMRLALYTNDIETGQAINWANQARKLS